MERYEALAREFLDVLDGATVFPPADRVSETMRGEAAVLRLLMRRRESLTPGDICRELGMRSPRVAAVLAGLEKKGLIVRGADADDRRRVPASLTDEGVAFCRRMHSRAVEEFSALLKQLGEEDAGQFVRILRRIVALPGRGPCEGCGPCEGRGPCEGCDPCGGRGPGGANPCVK